MVSQHVLAFCLLIAATSACNFTELFLSLKAGELSLAEYTERYTACIRSAHGSPATGYQPSCDASPKITQAVVKFSMSGSYVDSEREEDVPYDLEGVISLVQISATQTRISGYISGARAFLDDSTLMSIHVHEHGEIDEKCASTGGHYNPCGTNHSNQPFVMDRHVADIGQFRITEDDDVTLFEFTDPQVKLNGNLSVLGRSITLHAGKDSNRVACGTIASANWEGSGRHPQVQQFYD